MELQQSPNYKNYIESLNWKVETIQGINIFVRKFPFIGGFAKIQRIETLPELSNLIPFFKKYHVNKLVLEAAANIDEITFKQYANQIRDHVQIISSPFIPTKTILVELSSPEDEIFKKFTEAKRRAVRKAIKNKIAIEESNSIQDLISIKNKSAGIFGFVTTSGAKHMWNAFRPKNATTLLAYTEHKELIAGIFLVFWENTAYYWIAGSTKKGKKLFAPTLLVWEAIKVSKKRGMKYLDFLGVWDERYPHDNKDWLGFTKFKEGFGGNVLYYPTHKNNELTK